MKKILSILSILLLAANAMAMTFATATEGTEYYSADSETYRYKAKGLSDGTVAIVSWYVSTNTSLPIPPVLYADDGKAYEVSQVGWYDTEYSKYWEFSAETGGIAKSSVTTIYFSEGIKTIAANFWGFTALKNITIPTTVTEIQCDYCFMYATEGCAKLENIYCAGATPAILQGHVFDGQYTRAKVYVRSEYLNTYKNSTEWKNFKQGSTWRIESKTCYAMSYIVGTGGGTGTIETGYRFDGGANYYFTNKKFERDCEEQIGWNENDNQTTVMHSFMKAYTPKKGYNFYPVWQSTQKTITYAAGANGTGSVAAETGCKGETVTLTSNTFTRAGYIQTGWSETDGGEKAYDLGGSYEVTDNITLYPFWKKSVKYYTVAYNKGTYGTGMIASQSKQEDVSVTLSSNTFSRAGYLQTGWATSDGGSEAYALGATYSTNANITLYPVWTEDVSDRYYLRGDIFSNGWSTSEGMMTKVDDHYSISVYIEQPAEYGCDFLIYCGTTEKYWKLNSGFALTFDAPEVTLVQDGSINANLRVCESATYTFSFWPATGKLTVTFPPTRYYLTGSDASLFGTAWAPTALEFSGTGNTRIAYLDIPYGTGQFEFKLTKQNGFCDSYTWYGNTGTISGDISGWNFTTGNNNNCKLNPACEGTYKFSLDLSTMKLSVDYPEGNSSQYYVTGDFCDWQLRDEYLLTTTEATVSIPLANATTYQFYLVNSCSGKTYSRTEAVTGRIQNQALTEMSTPCSLTTTVGGEYVFKLKSTHPNITIYYPEASDYYLSGDFNSWATSDASYRFSQNTDAGSSNYVLGADITGCEYYTMKVVHGDDWWGDKGNNTATFNYTSTGWEASTSGSNWGIKTQKSDIYRITFDATSGNENLSVKFPSPYFALMGDFNDWSRCSHAFPDNAIIAVELAANTEYRMQVVSDNGYWGLETYGGLDNPSHLITSSVYNVTTTQGSDVAPTGFALVTTFAGTYSFAFDYENHTLTVIYPDVELVNLCKDENYLLPRGYTYSGDISYILENRFYGKELGQFTVEGVNQSDLSHVAYSFSVEDCPYDYRIESQTAYGTFHSNIVNAVSDSLSVYGHPSGTSHWQRAEHGSNTWQTGVNNLQIGKGIAEPGIYHTVFTSLNDGTDITGSWNRYTGDVYVFDADKTQIGTETRFTPGDESYEYFDHYLISQDASGVTLGDEINTCLSYDDGRYTAATLHEGDVVRYIYNAADNHFQRTILGNPVTTQNYLVLYGDNVRSAESGGSALSTNTNSVVFSHTGNQVYEADFYATPNCAIHLAGKYGSDWQYLLDKAGDAATTMTALGSVSGESKALRMHIYYDFKTNHILVGWAPSEYNTTGSVSVGSNLILRRVNKTLQTPFSSSFSGSASVSGKVYFVQEFDGSVLTSSLADRFYFFSLPYVAKIGEMYGLDDFTYGISGNWKIQRYRGDKRATNGESATEYWATLKQTTSLEIGRGYEIGISDLVYPEGQKLTGTWSGSSYPSATTHSLRLIMPSATTGFSVMAPQNYESTTVVAMQAANTADIETHSHWNVLGIPGLVEVSPYAVTNNNFTGLRSQAYPNYIYTWNGRFNDYTVNSITDFTFEPLMSYFVQYYGTIQWGASSTPAAMPRRTANGKNICDLYSIALYNQAGERVDRTYASWSSTGDDDYEFMTDLVKVRTSEHAQLYTTGITTATADLQFAAQDVPRKSDRLPLTLTVDGGEYTIALESAHTTQNTVSPLMLYDTEENRAVCLTAGEHYSFRASGALSDRFVLGIIINDDDTEVATSAATAESGIQIGISGGEAVVMNAGNATLRLYDTAGHLLSEKQCQGSAVMPLPAHGIFLLQASSEGSTAVYRIVH